jgi:hypothetical protein
VNQVAIGIILFLFVDSKNLTCLFHGGVYNLAMVVNLRFRIIKIFNSKHFISLSSWHTFVADMVSTNI